MTRSVCLKPISMETWRLRTLWRFTAPAYESGNENIHDYIKRRNNNQEKLRNWNWAMSSQDNDSKVNCNLLLKSIWNGDGTGVPWENNAAHSWSHKFVNLNKKYK